MIIMIFAIGRGTIQREEEEIQMMRFAFEQEIVKLENKLVNRIAKMFKEQKGDIDDIESTIRIYCS